MSTAEQRRPDRLRLIEGDRTFHQHRTVEQLAAEQGISGPQDLASLAVRELEDDELEAFVAAAADS